MSSLEESIHQVFSSILSHVRENQPIIFEEESFTPRKGIFDSSDVAILDASSGLIGSSHPLYIKTSLQSAISGQIVAEESFRAKVIQLFEDFLSKTIGEKVFLSTPIEKVELSDMRVPEFLTKKSLENLNNGKSVTLEGLLPETVAIQKTKLNDTQFFGLKSEFNLRFCENLIRFLQLGQFYGSNGLIKNRESQLKEAFKDTDLVKSIDGLVVELSNPCSSQAIKANNNFLIFPTSFDKDQLAKVKKSLESECLS